MRYTKGIMESDVGSFMSYTKGTIDPEVGNIAWTTELETGIDVLDEQHRRYFDLLNDYFEKAAEHSGADEKVIQLTESLDFLLQYAGEHFSTEKSIMQEAEYPDYHAHQEEHLYFMAHVGKLHKAMETKGFSLELFREVNYYIVEWFTQHILSADMQLVEFLKAKHWQA